MTQTYSTQTIAQQLETLGVPSAALVAGALTALLTGRSACVQQVANLLPIRRATPASDEAHAEANRQQIRRLLDQPALSQAVWATTVAALLPIKGPWVLALDRTEWKLGKTTINLLVLAVVCSGCAVPLLWLVLDKAGASDTGERVCLLQRFVALFGKDKVRFVTADREFIGQEWIGWLLSQELPFRIRIKAGEWLRHEDGRQKRAGDWFRFRACACKERRLLLWGLCVFVGGTRLRRHRDAARDEFLIVISNEMGNLLEEYRLRWKIETLFQALKGRGFAMESCRLWDPVRLSCWFGVLSLALVWCLRVGQFLEQVRPLPLKKHGRAAQSVFHRGMSQLQSLLAPLSGRACEAAFVQAVGQLRPAALK